MGAVHRIWLVAALFSTACASNGADLPSASSATAPSVSAVAEPLMGPDWVEVSEPNAAAPAWPLSTGLASDVGLESPMPGTTAIPDPELPKDWTLSLRDDRASIADPVVNHSHDHAHSHSAPIVDESESDPIWRDIAPGAADEGGTGSDRYQLPPASLKGAWTEVSSGRYRVLRPATEEELDGYRVIAPPPEAKDWMSRCVNHHADPSVTSPWPQDVRVSQAVLGCTTSAGLMEQAVQRYGAERGCVQQAYSDDYSVINGQGNSWTQCPTIGNPTPLDGRPFAEKCREVVFRGLEVKGHPRVEKVAADTCGLVEADLDAHLAVPGTTRLCAEHWLLNAVLNAEAPGAVPGLQQHTGVNSNETC